MRKPHGVDGIEEHCDRSKPGPPEVLASASCLYGNHQGSHTTQNSQHDLRTLGEVADGAKSKPKMQIHFMSLVNIERLVSSLPISQVVV